MKPLKVRKLKASEVTFTVSIEPEDSEVNGHFCSGDPDYAEEERKQERQIIRDLDRGYQEVWCCLVVTAEWEGIKGHASLGCCSFEKGDGVSVDKQAHQCAEEHDMQQEALDDLNRNLQTQADRFRAFLNKLSYE